MGSEILFVKDSKVFIDSRVVAREFDREHKTVLDAIRKLIERDEDLINEQHFMPVEYTDAKGESRPSFLMDRDGFMHLVMGFTGEKAHQVRKGIIKQFNEMEAALKAQVNQQAAKANLVSEEAMGIMKLFKWFGEEVRCPQTIALTEGVKQVKETHNIDLSKVLTAGKISEDIQYEDKYLEVTELGVMCGLQKATAGREVNKVLATLGLQKRENNRWIAIGEGISNSSEHFWKSENNTKSGYNLKWKVSFVLPKLRKHYKIQG